MDQNVLTRGAKRGKGPGSKPRFAEMLGISAKGIGELVRRVQAGFGFSALVRFQKTSGFPLATIAQLLQIPPRTLARRKAIGRLAPQESERLLRIAHVFAKAVDLFEGDVAEARNWFSRPKRALDYESPISFAKTELGAREVEELIDRLEYGIFS